MTKRELEIIKEVVWMGNLWARSLIDSHVPNAKRDLKKAERALKIVKSKLETHDTDKEMGATREVRIKIEPPKQ